MRRLLRMVVLVPVVASCSSRDRTAEPPVGHLVERSAEIVAALQRVGAFSTTGAARPALPTELPAHAAAPLRLGAGDAWIEVTPVAVREVSGVDHGRLARVYANAADDVDLVYVREEGRAEELRLAHTRAAAARSAWNLRLGPALAGLQIVDGRIEAVDRQGMLRFATEPAFAIDAAGVRRPLTLSMHGSTIEGRLDVDGLVTPIAIDPAWIAVSGPSALTRVSASLTRLKSGKVLLAGGQLMTTGERLSTAQVFDPATNAWSATANNMSRIRAEHSGTWFGGTSTKVVLVGGYGNNTETTAELYDEATNSFVGVQTLPAMTVPATGTPTSERRSHVAVAMPSGDVLVVGGRAGTGEHDTMFLVRDLVMTPLAGKLRRPSQDLQGVLLPDGRVLVAGGASTQGGFFRYQALTDLISISGTTATVTAGGNLPIARVGATSFVANAGPNAGKAMLIAGAITSATTEDQVVPSAGGVIYDTTSNTWSPLPNLMSTKRYISAGGLLPSGKVLITGGIAEPVISGPANADAEILDLATMTWKSAGNMNEPRAAHAGVVLADGSFLVVGGVRSVLDGVLTLPTLPAERFALQVIGAECASDGQCASGSCVDRVCCDRACDGQCEACDVTGSKGTCTVVSGAPHGTRPRCREPAPGDEPACAATCNGTDKACAFAATTVVCGANACAAGVETHASTCDGAGKCKDAPKSCGDFVCAGTACKTSCTTKADCSNAAHFCEAGKCIPQQANGAACARDEACASGTCVDGVCCESKCDGQCQACDVPGQAGKCVPIKGRPHGTRVDCAKDSGDACKSASCDGTNTASCAATVGPCGNYACDDVEKVCKKTCANNGDCGAGFECDTSGKCVPRTSKCIGLDTMQAGDGTKTQCLAFVCRDGSCLDKCTSSNDCLNGFACDGNQCVSTAGQASAGEDGGGCSHGGRPSGSPLWLSLALIALRRRVAKRGTERPAPTSAWDRR